MAKYIKVKLKAQDEHEHNLLKDIREHMLNLGEDEMIEIYDKISSSPFPRDQKSNPEYNGEDYFDYVYETIEPLFSGFDDYDKSDALMGIRNAYDTNDIDWVFAYDPWDEDDDGPQFDPGHVDEDYSEGMRDPGRDDEYE